MTTKLCIALTWTAVAAAASTLAGCDRAASTSSVKTELGEDGDMRVYSDFQSYEQKSQHCAASGTGKRVIVTGFGLFTGVPYNISGVVVGSFADARFTPAAISTTGAAVSSGAPGELPDNPFALADADAGAASGPKPSDGRVPSDALGAVAVNRLLTIDGEPYDVCFLTLDVIWDQAASIILYEASEFQPDMVYMSGRNSNDITIFEGGAANHADSLAGYNSNGTLATDNAPEGTYILNPKVSVGKAPSEFVPMTWDNQLLADKLTESIRTLGYPVQDPKQWRPGNDYLCNNVSYVMLSAAQGVDISLAGDYLDVTSSLPAGTKIGFMHFPASASNAAANIQGWVSVMAKAIKLTLN